MDRRWYVTAVDDGRRIGEWPTFAEANHAARVLCILGVPCLVSNMANPRDAGSNPAGGAR